MKTDVFGNGKRMQNVVQVKVIDILAGDDVYFGVPIGVQIKKGVELHLLISGERRKICIDNAHYNRDNFKAMELSRNKERMAEYGINTSGT